MRFVTIELAPGRTFWNCGGINLNPTNTKTREFKETELTEPFKKILGASVKAGEVRLTFRVEEEAKTFLVEETPATVEEAIEVLVEFNEEPSQEETVAEEYLKLSLVKLKNRLERDLKDLDMAASIKLLDKLLEAEENARNRNNVRSYLRELLDSKVKQAGIKVYDSMIEEEEGELITFSVK